MKAPGAVAEAQRARGELRGLAGLGRFLLPYRRRIAAAEKVVQGFMIGTECGFGRRDPATIPKLLEIHAQAAAG